MTIIGYADGMNDIRALSHAEMRRANTNYILECIREKGPITKRKIQQLTKLSWGTVSGIIGVLLKDKIIIEKDSEDQNLGGRKPRVFDINPDRNYLLGIDVSLEGITGVLIDLKYRVVSEISRELSSRELHTVFNQIEETVSSLIETGGGKDKVLGIGLALPGYVDPVNGIWRFTHHFIGAQNNPIQEEISRRCGLPVKIDHDPRCVALMEQRIGCAKQIENFVLIRISMGIGMALIVGGHIYTGNDAGSGEFGHITVQEGGPLCQCGRYGCLEEYSSNRAVIQYAMTAQRNGSSELLSNLSKKGSLSVQDVIACADENDPASLEILHRAATYLGIAVANIINVLNPDLLSIHGELGRSEKHFALVLRETVEKHVWKRFNRNITFAEISGASAAIGAALLFAK